MSDTIIALATPPLKAALALIRVSGKNAFEITRKLFSNPSKIDGTRKMVFGEIRNGDKTIDQVMLLLYPSSSSMTGEEVVEISCHGSMVVANEIIETYLASGARYAKNGEFTERAFLNGKIDLIESEAVNEMINASTREGKDLSLLSLKGETSSLIRPIEKSLADLLSLIEVNIDYPEFEDIEVANEEKIVSESEKIRKTIANLIQNGEKGKIIKEGVKVSIVGVPNVGKSSLLNALLDEDKAIVSPIAGTTRDLVEGSFAVNGIPFYLLDTAGLRKTEDLIEKIGVQKSEESIQKSDLVLLVLDASSPFLPMGVESLLKGKLVLKVYNKSDLYNGKKETDGVYVSALHKDVENLKKKMVETLGINAASFNTPSLSNARQIGLLKQIDSLMSEAQKEAKENYPIDLINVSIHKAWSLSKELLGEDVTNDISDEIFSRFCVGK